MHKEIIKGNCQDFLRWFNFEFSRAYSSNKFDEAFVLKKLFIFMKEQSININSIDSDYCLSLVKEKYAPKVPLVPATEHGTVYTVGELLKSLVNVPPDLPVLIARLEDSLFEKQNWKSYYFKWEKMNTPINEKSYKDLLEYISKNPDVTEELSKNGKEIWQYTEYAYAFQGICTSNKDGEYGFCITPHY